MKANEAFVKRLAGANRLEAVLEGDLDEIIDALITDDQARKLAKADEN